MRRSRRLEWFLGSLLLVACHPNDQHSVTAEPPRLASAAVPVPVPAPKPAAPEPEPARVEHLLVPGDLVASVVRSSDGSPPVTVFLPGLCSNANAYLQTFPEAARRQGGVVAIEGDQPCGNLQGFHSFSWDASRQHARVEAALAAAGLHEIPKEGVTIVGYSQGAALAEQMVQRWPGRYARVVLIGAPTNPAPKSFERARGLVTMSCDRDVPARMKAAAAATAHTGVPATYFEMVGCSHGNVTEGERVFGATFDWLRTNQRAPDPRATAIQIVGTPPA
jgi:pimeloyl-ACP methyl ester carboxylesterase